MEHKLLPILIIDILNGNEGAYLGQLWDMERGTDSLRCLLACGDDGTEMRQAGE